MKPAINPNSKPYFFSGHRKPTSNRPVVHGGLFSNRQSVTKQPEPHQQFQPFNIHKWDPQLQTSSPSPSTRQENHHHRYQLPLSASQRLSPIARFILDACRKNNDTWGPPVVAELNKLRRVTPDIVAEVLKVHDVPTFAAKLFHWAGKQKGYKHTFASYNAFAYCLNRKGHFRAADQLPELMESQGKPPSEKQFEILIRMHADNSRGLRVYYIYEKMKRFGVKPRVFLYNRVMDALVKTGYLDLAMSVYDDFRGDGLVEESVTFMILIKGLCKAGRIEEMFEILGRMRDNVCKPDVFAYTAMIRALVSQGNLDGSVRVWAEMKRDKVEPDVMAYATMVNGLCKIGRVQRGYELFREMKKKGVLIDRAIYAVLIEGFVADRNLGSACDLLKDLSDSGYQADLGIYNSIIGGLCAVKHVDKAYKLFQAVVQEELEPDFETVNPILVSYGETLRMDDFCKFLEQMQKLGFSVMEDLCKFFLFVVEEQERIVMALEIFEVLKLKGYVNVSVFNILMEALCMAGNIQKALSLFDEIKDSKIEPDSTTYNIAIKCLIEKGDVQVACLYHNKIIEMSCVPSVGAYSSLARGLCKIGEIDEAMMLVRDCLGNVTSGPMVFKYVLTIIHVCRWGAEKVMEVLDEMIEEGCSPDEVIYSAIISGMSKHGTVEEAREVFKRLGDRNLLTEANTIVYDELLIEHMKKKTADLVLSGVKFFGLESKLKAKGCRLLSS